MDKVKMIAQALYDKKATEIDILDISELTSLGNYFIICTCSSTTQVRACVNEVEDKMAEAGIHPTHKEGYQGGSWVLMDFTDVIVHVMLRETREFYALERLWDDAPRVSVELE